MIRTFLSTALLAILAAGAATAVPSAARSAGPWPPGGSLPFLPATGPFSDSAPQEVRAAVHDRLAAGQTVHLKMVVLLVDFSDRPASGAQLDLESVRTRLFSRGVLPKGSMADYYFENSNGRLLLDGTVRGWYRAPQSYSSYASGQAGIGFYPLNSQGLAEQLVGLADPDINFALFDDDGSDGVPDTIDDDEFIDLLMIVHTGNGTETSSNRSELRAIAWNLVRPLPVDGVNAVYFALCPWSGTTGVFAHETGHLLGLPDLYDATGRSFGLGAWSLMSGGWSLNGGDTPAHLDAWCKYRLGFVDPINVSGTLDDVVMAPVETGGPVYRLARNGSIGLEYFLVENRQRLGYDAFLPGEGILIYHVDELVPSNNLPPHYLVGLEQADGLYQLENLYGNPSFGDPGDCWTATNPTEGFGRFTVPDSRMYDGLESGVTVYRIQGPDAERRMTASFRALRGAVARIDHIVVQPLTGDGDGFIEAGESFELRPEIFVEGGDVTDVSIDLVSGDPQAGVEVGRADVGALAAGHHPDAVVLRGVVGGGLTSNPYPLPYTLTIHFREEVASRNAITIGAGDQVGLAEDFEADSGGFQSRQMRISVYDLWRQEISGGHPGRAWHAGLPGSGALKDTDGGLTTPLFLIPPAGRLVFDQQVDITPNDSNVVVAGGFVEISVNGGAWTSLPPTRGYDRTYFSGRPEYNGRGIFTGARYGVWEPMEFDLSRYSGSAQVRFRFFSVEALSRGIGWWIDNVAVESSETAVRLLEFTAASTDAGVRLSWRLDPDDLPLQTRLYRVSAAGAGQLLATFPGAAAGEWLDDPEDGLASRRYRLEALDRRGAIVSLGQIDVSPEPPARLNLSADPNPSRGSPVLTFTLATPGSVRLNVYDHLGRPVRRFPEEVRPAGVHRLAWDGRDDDGRPVAGGLYFVRLESGLASAVSRLVVMP